MICLIVHERTRGTVLRRWFEDSDAIHADELRFNLELEYYTMKLGISTIRIFCLQARGTRQEAESLLRETHSLYFGKDDPTPGTGKQGASPPAAGA